MGACRVWWWGREWLGGTHCWFLVLLLLRPLFVLLHMHSSPLPSPPLLPLPPLPPAPRPYPHILNLEQPLSCAHRPGQLLAVLVKARAAGGRPAAPLPLLTVRTLPPRLPAARTPAAGLGASELYVVKAGEFEVLQRRKGVNIRVNMKRRGDTFGEVALMFNCPRSATVAATQDSVVWVLEREVFRQYVRQVQESQASQLELFLNSGEARWMGESENGLCECVGGWMDAGVGGTDSRGSCWPVARVARRARRCLHSHVACKHHGMHSSMSICACVWLCARSAHPGAAVARREADAAGRV